MPAWITSLLRELVSVPIMPAASRTSTSRPDSASWRATARPITPAPITTQSTRSIRTSSDQRLDLLVGEPEAPRGAQDLGPGALVHLDAVRQKFGAAAPFRLARHQHLVEAGARPRRFHVADQRADLVEQPAPVPERVGIDDHRKHVVDDAARARMRRLDR